MSTWIFNPHPDINKLPDDFKSRWSAALKSSRQYRGDWISSDMECMCCLGVALSIQGKDVDYISSVDSLELGSTLGILFNAPQLGAAIDDEDNEYSFSELNDDYLTHRQIADLLEGKSVAVEVDDA